MNLLLIAIAVTVAVIMATEEALYMPTPAQGHIDSIIRKYAMNPPANMNAYDFERLIRAVIQKESNWRQDVIGITGDIGLMQINPSNAPAYNLTRDDLFDPDTNIRVGSDILRWSINNYGLKDGLAAYNGGPAKRTIPITQAYAQSVIDIYNRIA